MPFAIPMVMGFILFALSMPDVLPDAIRANLAVLGICCILVGVVSLLAL